MSVNQKFFNTLIQQALQEDLGEYGDITSCSIFSKENNTRAIIKAKSIGIISGIYLIEPIFKSIDTSLSVELSVSEGEHVKSGTIIATITGSIRAILSAERTVLNFLQRLSGIASQTGSYIKAIEGTNTKLLDTRKTTPGMRHLEKQAVVAGGGTNHRIGLYDMILIKDTHVKAAGAPDIAIRKAKAYCKKFSDIKIEVEVQNLEEFKNAITAKPDRIMLDNMSCDLMRQCVELSHSVLPSLELEASGNVTLETIREIAETGVDFISVGSLTHSVRALDIHLVLV